MRLALTLALTVLSTACTSQPAEAGDTAPLTAKGRAIDGDTVSIDIRLLGADAFERRQLCRGRTGCWKCGKAAQDLTSQLLKGGDATIRLSGKQSYGRPIGSVEIGGEDLGERVIAAGLAVPATDFLKNDPACAQRYVAAYEAAQKRRLGGHAGYFIEPASGGEASA